MLNLWVGFSLLPGEAPFEAAMCAVGAASQISECLWRILFLIQNITCYLCRNLYEKRLVSFFDMIIFCECVSRVNTFFKEHVHCCPPAEES